MEEDLHPDDDEDDPFSPTKSELRKAAEIGQNLLLAKMELTAKLDEMAKEKKKMESSLSEWNDFAQKLGASTAGILVHDWSRIKRLEFSFSLF
jgi:hypothetical protein